MRSDKYNIINIFLYKYAYMINMNFVCDISEYSYIPIIMPGDGSMRDHENSGRKKNLADWEMQRDKGLGVGTHRDCEKRHLFNFKFAEINHYGNGYD